MKYLVAFGCSHTNGSMVDGVSGSSAYTIANGFPGMIAQKYDYHLYNISKPGGSNAYIHRSIVDYITNHMNKDAEHLFLINWTSRPRIELRYKESSAHKHDTHGHFTDKKSVPFTVGTNPALFFDKDIQKLLNFTPYIINDEIESQRWATWAYGVQCMLENLNIPYLMTNTCEALPVIPTNYNITEKLNTKKYITPFDTSQTMLEFLQNKGIEKTPCWHFQKDGHELWAKKLCKHLKDLSYV